MDKSAPALALLLLLFIVHSSTQAQIYGVNFEYASDKKRVDFKDGQLYVQEKLEVDAVFYGNFEKEAWVEYSRSSTNCENEQHSEGWKLNVNEEDQVMGTDLYTSATVHLTMPLHSNYPELYFCTKSNSSQNWTASGPRTKVHLDKIHLPTWLHLLLIILLLVLSGLFSGLNLGLMSLNKTDLKIIANTGTPTEREYASKIAPVRNHGNFLLCCLLFSNVLVNATLTILVDELTTGLVAIIMSTLAIVIFGEIIPQAICSRHGLAVGARTIYITKFFMAITFLLAYPLSKLLDKCLGEEIGSVYTRERLKELLKVTKDHHGLENEEVGIISGALDMKTKSVRDIMTSLDTVFMINIDSILDFDTLAEIDFQGYSRIPVYEHERGNVVAVLNVKQLTLLDGSDNIPIRTVVEYYKNSLFYVFENTRLDYMFKAFREGNRGHMAFVQKVNDEGPGDPYYETVGVVTMEDVLEELLQAEIMDETDVGKYQARLAHKERPRIGPLAGKRKNAVEVQPQLALATVQYLATNLPAFDRAFISENIVHRLLTTSVFVEKPFKSRPHEPQKEKYLYKMGEPSDSFILILEGKVEVSVGKEKLVFEAGPFHHFGADWLKAEFGKAPPSPNPSFTPDYTVRVTTAVYFMRLKYSGYVAARQATEMERKQNRPEDWQEEIDKVLFSETREPDQQGKRVHIAPSTSNGPVKVEKKESRRKSEPAEKAEMRKLL